MIENSFQHYLLGLIAVANNIPALAPFIALTVGINKKIVNKLVAISSAGAFIIMIISMFFGTMILDFFGISISAFQIAGGVLLCNTGVNMLNAKTVDSISDKQIEHSEIEYSKFVSATIVPITMPLTTGAGTISTITLFAAMAKTSHTMLSLFLAITAMTLITFICFYFANNLVKILGSIGISVLIKVMGLFTLAIGIQFILTGITTVYKGLG